MNGPEISKMLTLSTAHVTPDTLDLIGKDADDNLMGLPIYRKESFGYFIYVPDASGSDDDGDPVYGFKDSVPDDLLALLRYCRDLGCGILCLDCDGPEVSYLPMYAEDEPDGTGAMKTENPFKPGDVVFRPGYPDACFGVRNVLDGTIALFGDKDTYPADGFKRLVGTGNDVIPVVGGRRSLYCRRCCTFVCNTANSEMKKEGCYAHSHVCGRRDPSEYGLSD